MASDSGEGQAEHDLGCQYGKETRSFMWRASVTLGAVLLFMVPVVFGFVQNTENRMRRHRESVVDQVDRNRQTISNLRELNGRLEERLKSIDESLSEIKSSVQRVPEPYRYEGEDK